jgi:hypothetical protein
MVSVRLMSLNMPKPKYIFFLIALLLAMAILVVALAQGQSMTQPYNPAASITSDNSPAEDFSGMYSFLKEGEFVQITLDKDGISGYISRQGTQESDRGVFLDQWFAKASAKGFDFSFTTKPLHSLWFEFKGTFSRGTAKAKTEDGYYVLRGTLTEFVMDAEKKTTSRAREVEFKLLAEAAENKKDKD